MSYPDHAGFKGRPDGPGADAAAYYEPQIKGRRLQVLQALEKGPGTAEEIGERCELHWYLTRPRLSELTALGLAMPTGERGKSAFGGQATIYRVSTPEERAVFAARAAVEAEKRGDK